MSCTGSLSEYSGSVWAWIFPSFPVDVMSKPGPEVGALHGWAVVRLIRGRHCQYKRALFIQALQYFSKIESVIRWTVQRELIKVPTDPYFPYISSKCNPETHYTLKDLQTLEGGKCERH